MNEEKLKEIIEEVADFFERRKDGIEAIRDYSIENIEARIENLQNVDSSKIIDEKRTVEERYNKQIQELENTRNAFLNIESKIDELKNKLNGYSKIHKLMGEIKSDVANSNEVNSELNKMFKIYDTEYNSIYAKYFNEFKEVLENAKNVASKNGYINEHINDNNSPTLGMRIEHMKKFYESLFILGTTLDEKTVDRPMTDSEEKLKLIEKYEKEVKQGHIFSLTKEVSTSSFFKKNRTSNVAIDTGKTTLLNILKIESRIKNMNEILEIMKMRQNDYSRTYTMMLVQLDKQKELLKKEKEKFEKSDFNLVEELMNKQKNDENRFASMLACANIQAEIEELLDKSPENIKRITLLQEQFEEYAKKGNLNSDEIRLAQLNGKNIYSEKEYSKKNRENIENEQKNNIENMSINDNKEEELLRDEIVKEMIKEGWKHSSYVPLKNGDTNFVEETKLWNEEVDRRLRQRLNERKKSKISEEIEKEHVEEPSVLDEKLNMDKLKEEIKSSIASRIELDSDGFIAQQEMDEKIAYYMSTMDEDRKERALKTLKREGYVPQNATIVTLNKVQQDALAAQMRIESSISDAMEQFKIAKAKNDEHMLMERQAKIGDLSETKGRHM